MFKSKNDKYNTIQYKITLPEKLNGDVKRKRTSERNEKKDKNHYLNLHVQFKNIDLNILRNKENKDNKLEITYGKTKMKKQRKKIIDQNEINKTVSTKQIKD